MLDYSWQKVCAKVHPSVCDLPLPFRTPLFSTPTPILPEFRIREVPPFVYTVVDFAGPLHSHSSEEKVWLCLFTCCATHTVHLETVLGLSTETFIMLF